YLTNFPTLDEIVRENGDKGLSAILENEIANHRDILFIAIENEKSIEKINRTYCYVFFDIRVPDGETPDKCKEKMIEILSGIVKSFKMEHIKAFPFHRYYTEKKPYLRIYTNGTEERKRAIKAVQDNNFEIASDDLYSFHQKAKNAIKPPEEGEKDPEEKEYID
ncbi:17775_t:CDS:2, partial [Dentiscutata erythropus]